jgi:hypothetical protein
MSVMASEPRYPMPAHTPDAERLTKGPSYAEAIEEDLTWLGLPWDGLVAQSTRLDRYALAAEKLKKCIECASS